MPTIAQKLCRDMVEPVFKPSSINTSKRKLSKKSTNNLIKQRSSDKTTHSVHIDKKIITKIIPSTSSSSSIQGQRSKEKTYKKCQIDSGFNTIISGPLRCDNNCVTMVRKRDNQISCKCGQQKKLNFNPSVNQMQTSSIKNCAYTDKACTHCVETATCGTQFHDISNLIKPKSKTKGNILNENSKEYATLKAPLQIRKPFSPPRSQANLENCNTNNNIYKPFNTKYVGAKRWAISNYPVRGPDF